MMEWKRVGEKSIINYFFPLAFDHVPFAEFLSFCCPILMTMILILPKGLYKIDLTSNRDVHMSPHDYSFLNCDLFLSLSLSFIWQQGLLTVAITHNDVLSSSSSFASHNSSSSSNAFIIIMKCVSHFQYLSIKEPQIQIITTIIRIIFIKSLSNLWSSSIISRRRRRKGGRRRCPPKYAYYYYY